MSHPAQASRERSHVSPRYNRQLPLMRSCRPGSRPRRSVIAPMLGLGLLLLAAAAAQPASAATTVAMRLRQKQMIRTDRLDIRRPAGIAYAAESDLFLVFTQAPAAGVSDAAPGRGVLLNRFHEGMGKIGRAHV